MKAWKCSHSAVMWVDHSADQKLSSAVFADNHIGITGQFYRNNREMELQLQISNVKPSPAIRTGSSNLRREKACKTVFQRHPVARLFFHSSLF